MRAKEIKITIQKTSQIEGKVWFGCTFELDENENIKDSFKKGVQELEDAYENAFRAEEVTAVVREELTMAHPKLKEITRQLESKIVTAEKVQKHYILSKEVFNYFQKHNLI